LAAKKKKKKLRVAFRKNRRQRTRAGDLTREFGEDVAGFNDLSTGERVIGKTELGRHRTVVGVETGDGDESFQLHVDESQCLAGRVLTAKGLHSIVQTESGTEYECTVRRLIRTLARETRNVVTAGDRVLFQPTGYDAEKDKQLGVIERIEPRRGTLSRASRRREHLIVANVDQILIVASAEDPPLKPNLIDRFLISAEKGEVHSIICINKCDLVDPASLQPLAGRYGRMGYEVLLTSATDGTGIARLKSLVREKQTVLAGQSGVGKSSLLNALQPGLGLRIAAVSADSRKGTHTTRAAHLLRLEFGGWVVDTPGLRQFELWDVIPEEVEGFFVEFRPFVTLCRFPDCSHTHEEGCGVKLATAGGLISPQRYASYCRILTDGD
jgi:ribosome biogenesis GTPase